MFFAGLDFCFDADMITTVFSVIGRKFMKKYVEYGVVIVVAALLGCAICCGCCCKKGAKIAVVDVQRIVAQSAPVAELRQDMQGQMSNLQAWVNASNEQIEKESSQEKKDALTKQYQEELMQKQQVIQKNYAERLQKLDSELTKIIEKTAAQEGISITLVKGSVAAGGVDITEKVIAKLSK